MVSTLLPPDRSEGVGGAAHDALILIVTASAAQIIAVALNVILRGELGPVGMGYVAIMLIILGYAPFVGLGSLQAAEREMPILIAGGRTGEADASERAATIAAFAGSVLAGCGLLLAGWFGGAYRDPLMTATISAGVAVLVGQQGLLLAIVRLRTRLRFRALAFVNTAQTVIVVAITLLGASLAGVPGALVASVLAWAGIGGIALALAGRPAILARGPLDARVLRLGPGFLASNLALVALLSIDQLAVGVALGAAGLGVYSAALLGKGFVLGFPAMVGTVIYPRLQRALGATSDMPSVARLSLRTTVMVALGMPVVVAAFFVTLPAIIYVALPEFREAVLPLRFLLLAAGAIAFGIPAIQLLLTLNRQWLESLATLAAVALLGVIIALLWRGGAFSLVSVAMSTAAVYALHAIAAQLLASRVSGVGGGELRWLGPVHMLPLAALALAGPASDLVISGTGGTAFLGRAAVQLAAFLLVWGPCVYLVLRLNPQARADVGAIVNRFAPTSSRLDR